MSPAALVVVQRFERAVRAQNRIREVPPSEREAINREYSWAKRDLHHLVTNLETLNAHAN